MVLGDNGLASQLVNEIQVSGTGLLFIHSFIHSFIYGMHCCECIVPNVNINLQSGRFWAMSIASFRERFVDFTSCWVVFIQIVRGHPGGLQFSKGEAVKICLASASSGIRAVWPNRERRHAWTVAERPGCSVFRLTSSFRTWWYHKIPSSLRRQHWSRASILSTSLLVTNCPALRTSYEQD